MTSPRLLNEVVSVFNPGLVGLRSVSLGADMPSSASLCSHHILRRTPHACKPHAGAVWERAASLRAVRGAHLPLRAVGSKERPDVQRLQNLRSWPHMRAARTGLRPWPLSGLRSGVGKLSRRVEMPPAGGERDRSHLGHPLAVQRGAAHTLERTGHLWSPAGQSALRLRAPQPPCLTEGAAVWVKMCTSCQESRLEGWAAGVTEKQGITLSAKAGNSLGWKGDSGGHLPHPTAPSHARVPWEW